MTVKGYGINYIFKLVTLEFIFFIFLAIILTSFFIVYKAKIVRATGVRPILEHTVARRLRVHITFVVLVSFIH